MKHTLSVTSPFLETRQNQFITYGLGVEPLETHGHTLTCCQTITGLVITGRLPYWEDGFVCCLSSCLSQVPMSIGCTNCDVCNIQNVQGPCQG